MPAEVERETVVSVLEALDVSSAEAATQARFLLEADLRGHPSHGIQRLPVIVGRIRRRLTLPGTPIVAYWNGRSVARVDGRRGLGPVVGMQATELVAQRAPHNGIALAAVHNSNHLGILAPYVEEMASRDLVGIALTTSEALVHPWGGGSAMLGTNPIAVAVPAKPEPFVLDMATGAVSMGKILAYREDRKPLPEGWAVDNAGRPTTDAARAANGAISPFGGPKGYALGLAFELLVAALTGTELGTNVRGTLDTRWVCSKGDLFLCIDPEVLGIEDHVERVSTFLATLRSMSTDPEGRGVLVPGDRARAERARRLREGVELSESVWAKVQAIRVDLVEG